MSGVYSNPYGQSSSNVYRNPYGSQSIDPIQSKIDRLEQYGYDAEIKPKKSVLETLLDLLSRPESASASLVGGMLKGQDIGTTMSDVGQSFTGKKKLTYTDLLKESGMGDNFGTKALGFILGTALDPLTYIPVSKIAKGIGKVGRVTPGVKQVMGAGDDAIKAARKSLGLTPLTGAAKNVDTITKGFSGNINYTAEEVFKKYEPVMRSMMSLDIDKRKLIGRAIEKPKIYLKKLDEAGLGVYNGLTTMFEETGRNKKTLGLVKELIGGTKSKQLVGKGIKLGTKSKLGGVEADAYLSHLATDKFREKSIEMGKSPEEMFEILRGLSRKGIAKVEKSRNLQSTIAYYNKLSKNKFGVDMFESDLAEIVPRYLHNYAKEVALLESNKELLGLVDDVGRPLFKKMAGETADNGMVKLSGLAFDGYQTTPDIAKMVNRVNGVLSSDPVLNKYLKGFDKMQNIWKKMVTVFNPTFTPNNAMGATFNNFIFDSDSMSPSVLKKLNNLVPLSGKNAAKETITSVTGKSMNGADFMTWFKKHGGLVSFVSPESALSKQNIAEKGINIMNEGVERVARTQLFVSQFQKTGDLYESLRNVWKVHGNYSREAMSTVERDVIKRAFPFYVWAKTNIPFQIQSLINKTGKYAGLARLQNQIVSPEERAKLPEWQREKLLLPIKNIDDNKKRVQSINLPIADLNDLSNPISKLIFGRMSPFLKAPIEGAFNKNIFYDKPIVDEELPFSMQKANAPDATKYLPEILKKAIGYVETTKPSEVTGEDKTTRKMGARLSYLMNTYGGQMSKYGNLPKTAENLGMEPNNVNTILGALAGVFTPFNPKVYDVREQEASNKNQQIAELQARINYLLQRGLIPKLK